MDEVSSMLGSVIAKMRNYLELKDIKEECEHIQQQLFDCGSDPAIPCELSPYKQTEEDTRWLEECMDKHIPLLPKLEYFIISGESKISAEFHMLRTAVRRLE